MDGEEMNDEGPSASKSKRMFFVGSGHSRNSSLNSLGGDEAEACVELLQSGDTKLAKEADSYSKGTEPSKRGCKVTGSCLCKLSVVFYLAVCVLISALYVAFYGKNQPIFGDAWIPGKVGTCVPWRGLEWLGDLCLRLWAAGSPLTPFGNGCGRRSNVCPNLGLGRAGKVS